MVGVTLHYFYTHGRCGNDPNDLNVTTLVKLKNKGNKNLF